MLRMMPILKPRLSSTDIKNLISLFYRNHTSNNITKYKFCFYSKLYQVQKYSTDGNIKNTTKKEKHVILSEASSNVSTTFETIKEGTKTLYYSVIISIGLGIVGFILFVLFNELFSSSSTNNIYSKAFYRCIEDERVIFSLGTPIKGFGEESRRGRRQHVSHLLYKKDGINFIRMKFYLKGSQKRATVHLEMKENEKGNFEYRYLFVQLDDYPYTTIILEDNRTDSH